MDTLFDIELWKGQKQTKKVHVWPTHKKYSNNDNKLGPNSGKFVLEKEPPKRKPAFSPLIDTAEAVSPSAIMIHWMVKVYDVI